MAALCPARDGAVPGTGGDSGQHWELWQWPAQEVAVPLRSVSHGNPTEPHRGEPCSSSLLPLCLINIINPQG